MDRRDFMKAAIATTGLACLGEWEEAYALGTSSPKAGKPWKGWKKGQFQVHFIYTGVSEAMFWIFPDGTTMLLDCGDHNAIGRGKLAVPVLPNSKRHAGEWIARYIQRVNPHGNEVDYMMLSHYHSDHAGCEEFYASEEIRDGQDCKISGFSQLTETIHVKKAFDRAWPGFDDPLPMPDDFDSGVIAHMKKFYAYEQAHHGMEIEKFRVGAVDQVKMLHNPSPYGDFSIRNISANGRICGKDGKVRDLYAERIAAENLRSVNENGMSLGMIVSYGDFRMFTAGDFSDSWTLEDGSKFEIEDAMADVVERVNVAKINHHGHYSMTEKLISALRAQVYVSCVWDQLHNVSPVMDRLTDRSIYPDDRIICPTIMPAERRLEDKGKAWLDDVAEASFEGGHVILNVEKGGRDYSITYLTADDESMTVRSVMDFKV